MTNLVDWLSLKNISGVGNLLFKRLIERFGSPGRALGAPAEELGRVKGVTRPVIESIGRRRTPAWIRKELEAAAENNIRIITFSDPDYPSLLRQIPDPPPYFYMRGSLEGVTNTVAMVGSRHATPYGLTTTGRLSRDLATLGFTVVSGMARGIDTEAHEGALAGGGKTIAVLGSGLLRIYPAENKPLSERIARNGAVISEFSLMAEPDGHHFPMRNRVISGISLGTVVVEATRRSGSLITARLAAEQNREVFAVPGSVQSFKSTGAHTLIKSGAKLVEHARDIVEEFANIMAPPTQIPIPGPASQPAEPPPGLSPDETRALNALGPYPIHIDELARGLSMDSGALSSALLLLELKGLVQQDPGKLFSIMPSRAT
ncbi:MAG: DNA-protecting protein DprA [Desulfobacterales bacterium]|nr:DNA-protecting protein DprA [Desulfobacterales bacterium]